MDISSKGLRGIVSRYIKSSNVNVSLRGSISKKRKKKLEEEIRQGGVYKNLSNFASYDALIRASISRHRRISKVTLISEGKKRRTFFPACKNRCLNSDGSKTASLNDGQSREFITFFENWYSSVDKWSSKKRILLKIPSRFIRRGSALEIKISSFVKDNKKEEQEGRNHSCRRASMTKTRNTEKQIFGKQTSGKNTGSYTYPSTPPFTIFTRAWTCKYHGEGVDIKINAGLYTSEYNIYIVRSRRMNISSRWFCRKLYISR